MDDTEGIDPEQTETEAEETEPPAVAPAKLAGGNLVLRLPANIAERWDLYLVSLRVPQISYLRVYAAAIGLCWPDFRKMLAKQNIVYSGDIVAFGGQVQVVLFSGSKPARERVDRGAFCAAGRFAVDMVSESVVSGEAVESKRDF